MGTPGRSKLGITSRDDLYFWVYFFTNRHGYAPDKILRQILDSIELSIYTEAEISDERFDIVNDAKPLYQKLTIKWHGGYSFDVVSRDTVPVRAPFSSEPNCERDTEDTGQLLINNSNC